MARKSKSNKDPVVVSFGEKPPHNIQFDPEEKQAFLLSGHADHMLVVAWDVDEGGRGKYRIKVVGIEDGELIKKELEPGNASAAFFGEVSVVGAKQTDLWASFGYEDEDLKDADGNIFNKVKEIQIKPKGED